MKKKYSRPSVKVTQMEIESLLDTISGRSGSSNFDTELKDNGSDQGGDSKGGSTEAPW